MENDKKYLLRNKNFGTYFKTRYYKGCFHYVVPRTEATLLTKKETEKLLKELHHPENYEILEVKKNGE